MKLNHAEKQFSFLFAIIVALEIISGGIDALKQLHYIAKPAIVLSLMIFFYKTSDALPKSYKRLTILALALALLGDILLMFVDSTPHCFTFGLIAFLLAHLIYIALFLKHRNNERKSSAFVSLLLAYGIILGYTLKDGLNEMRIPVLIYMLVILSMATCAYLRRYRVSASSYTLVFIGALSFMISDSVLALNKFYQPLPLSGLSIMLSYALAQYLIVLGILRLKEV